ncbi:uncharacterized protein LOC141533369 isoform X1 [Cotesia typhae]|uniref:uncharacterized protein LOC141533369 isoform X1 n=1 Tax=Cotesia typhae TaxID=2053667 RepID=UPI003D684663
MPTVSPRCVIPRAKNFKVQTLKMTIQPPIVAQPSRQNVISDNLLQYGAEDLQEDDYKSLESECIDRFSGAGVPKFSLQKKEMTRVFLRSDRKYAPLSRTSAVLLAVGGSSRERRLTRSAHTTANRRVFFSLRSTETPARRRQ